MPAFSSAVHAAAGSEELTTNTKKCYNIQGVSEQNRKLENGDISLEQKAFPYMASLVHSILWRKDLGILAEKEDTKVCSGGGF